MEEIEWEQGFQRRDDATRKGHGVRMAGSCSRGSQGRSRGKAVKRGSGAKILRLGGSRESPTRDVRAWRDGTPETLRPRWGSSVTQRHTAHAHTRARTCPRASTQTHLQGTRAHRTLGGFGLASDGGDSPVEPQREPGGPSPPRPYKGLRNRRRLRRAPAALCFGPARPGPAHWREREERRGGGSGKGCVPAVCGFRKAGAGRARGGAAASIKSPAARA